MLHKLQ